MCASCRRAHAAMMRRMLEASPIDAAAPPEETVTMSRHDLERLQGELKFAQARVAALNFEIARLKRWRFGQSSESLEAQVPLFEAIATDTALEDQAARDERSHRPDDAAGKKRRAVRQALPAALPRIEHRHDL